MTRREKLYFPTTPALGFRQKVIDKSNQLYALLINMKSMGPIETQLNTPDLIKTATAVVRDMLVL